VPRQEGEPGRPGGAFQESPASGSTPMSPQCQTRRSKVSYQNSAPSCKSWKSSRRSRASGPK
jgi:hypothetical protein